MNPSIQNNRSSSDAYEQMKQYFQKENLNVPFIPENQKAHVMVLSDCVFATTSDLPDPYDLPLFFHEVLSKKVSDYVLVGFSGHGVASRAMHYYSVDSHLALFFQISYGNVSQDQEATRSRVRAVFHSASVFHTMMQEAVQKGLIPSDQRLVVVVSDFHPSGFGWVTGTPGTVSENEWRQTSDFLLALEKIPLTEWSI